MASVVRMPSVLADATEAAIANWLVGPGDKVAVGDPMVEIETEKAIVEYQAEEPGIVGRLGRGDGGADRRGRDGRRHRRRAGRRGGRAWGDGRRGGGAGHGADGGSGSG